MVVDLLESAASCEFFVDHLQVPAGRWGITCDIGGATMDTAMCVTQEVKGRIFPDTFPVACVLNGHNAHHGVVMIDEELGKELIKLEKETMIKNLDIGKRLDVIKYGHAWRKFRHNFDGNSDFSFPVDTASYTVDRVLPEGFQIKGSVLTVSRYAISTALHFHLRTALLLI